MYPAVFVCIALIGLAPALDAITPADGVAATPVIKRGPLRAKKLAMRGKRRTTTAHRSKPDPVSHRVGARVRQLRAEQELTFDRFVALVGLGRGYVSELERGLVVPSLHALVKVAKALRVTVADLVIGNIPREQLFAATRGLPVGRVVRLLSAARRVRPG